MVASALSTKNGSALDIGSLVEPERTHRRVYADPEVFDVAAALGHTGPQRKSRSVTRLLCP